MLTSSPGASSLILNQNLIRNRFENVLGLLRSIFLSSPQPPPCMRTRRLCIPHRPPLGRQDSHRAQLAWSSVAPRGCEARSAAARRVGKKESRLSPASTRAQNREQVVFGRQQFQGLGGGRGREGTTIWPSCDRFRCSPRPPLSAETTKITRPSPLP